MAKPSHQVTQITIDTKKSRVRIYKSALHLMGDPLYIQLLVNCENRQVAIRAVDKAKYDGTAHRLNPSTMDSDFSYEIYSTPFIARLRGEFNCFPKDTSYRLTGIVIPEEKVCVFPLSSIQPIESEVPSDHA